MSIIISFVYQSISQRRGHVKSNEWYTPALYIEAARAVMGGIDLDPASCELANRTVKADHYYTKEDNGLMLSWYGRIWCNPPFGRIHPERTGSIQTWQKAFAQKAWTAYHFRHIEQCILLTIGFQKVWYQPFWDFPICICPDRIEFDRPDGTKEAHRLGNCFVYLGPHGERFSEVFSRFGRIVKAIDQPKQRYIQHTFLEAIHDVGLMAE
jgi:hypothetical protein